MNRAVILAVALAITSPAHADEVTDTLQSAIDAYTDGDIQYALEELDFARQKLLELKTDSLGAFLPEAPEGWTRELNSEVNATLGMMGGGVGAEAEYNGPSGARVKITLMADNPMVASMAAMISNAGAMGMKTERIGRQRFAVQDRQVMALIGNRVLVQADGEFETVKPLLEAMDFEAMAGFGS